MFVARRGVHNLQNMCLKDARTVTQLAGRSFLPNSQSKNFPKYLKEASDNFPHVFKLHLKKVFKPELGKFGRSFRPILDKMVDKYGVVVLRGFNIDSAIPFSEFFQALGYPTMPYYSGTGVKGEVATSVAAPRSDPPICTVEPHNEMTYVKNSPDLVFLFNQITPARSCGGEVVLVDTRDIMHELEESVINKFKRHGVRYYHHLPGEDSVFPSWQQAMQTSDRAEVERHLKAMDTQYVRWDEDGSLTYWTTQPAMVRHHKKGDMVWFNEAVSLHASHWRAHPKFAHIDLPETRYPHTTLYGDGSQIESDVLQHIREVTWRNAVGTKLEKGDIMVLDNMYVQHGRLGYSGQRLVLISLTRRDNGVDETDSD
ncbi:dapdiamide synthesis protein DdaC-like [Lineus longissimus]|uniref:dapdiamide synthesis protein DdaC-like n=1 Tax=Lineus longissimus TaxID=88925 RepID=UPI00315D478D